LSICSNCEQSLGAQALGARKENSVVLCKQGHVRTAEAEGKPASAPLCSCEPGATGCGRGFRTEIKYSCGRTCLACFGWICALKFGLKTPSRGAVSPTTARWGGCVPSRLWVLLADPAAGAALGTGLSQLPGSFRAAFSHC